MIKKIKAIIANNNMVMRFASFFYNILHYNNSWRFKSNNKISYKSAFLKKVKFSIIGKNNVVLIGRKARLTNCSIVIYGSNCKLFIGGAVR